MERKLICGKPHVRKPCLRCGALIWVRKGTWYPVCDDCYKVHCEQPAVGNPHDCEPRSERIYERGG